MTAPISKPVVALLSAFVEERTGLRYDERDIDLFADKLMARASVAGFDSAPDYYYYLRYDAESAAELEALIDALIVTETYFFREADALRAVIDHVIAPRARAGDRPRIWSAACASGDEPVTIAMLLDERGLLGAVDIVATDISLTAYKRSREIGWGARSTRSTPPHAFERWLSAEGDRVRVDRRLLDGISSRSLNLLDEPAMLALGTFDVIVCRNVFIYFSDETIQRVVASMAKCLRKDGRLLVGATESLLRFGTVLECEERAGTFLYRRSEE